MRRFLSRFLPFPNSRPALLPREAAYHLDGDFQIQQALLLHIWQPKVQWVAAKPVLPLSFLVFLSFHYYFNLSLRYGGFEPVQQIGE